MFRKPALSGDVLGLPPLGKGECVLRMERLLLAKGWTVAEAASCFIMTFLHFFLTNKTPAVVGDALCLLERKLRLSVFREENGGPVTKF